MPYTRVQYRKEGDRATITLNRPDKLNAIDDTMFLEMHQALQEAEADREVKLLIYEGAGGNFSAGADLSGNGTSLVVPPDPRTRPFLNELFQTVLKRREILEAIYDSPKMTIAKVQGYCLGLGLDIAMMCETIVASEDSVLGDPSIRMGLATQNPLWTWRVGPRRSKELLLTGRYFTGAEALRYGMVTIACPTAKLAEETTVAAEGMIHRGGMGGYDSYIYGKLFARATWDGAGLAAAWSMTAGLHGLSAIQRRGFRPDEFNFWEAREKSGMKGAVKQRDARVKQLFPWKKPS